MAYYMFLPLIFASGFQEADSELEDDPFYRVPHEFRIPWYEQLSWKPEEHFSDAAAIRCCHAIVAADLQSVEKLLAGGLDVNTKGKANSTLLLWAFSTRDTRIFQRLLEEGADPNVRIADSFGTLSQTCRHHIFPGDSVTLLASRMSFGIRFDLVMSHGGDINFQSDSSGMTPLMVVLTTVMLPKERLPRVKFLLKTKVALNVHEKNSGRTPLMFACDSEHYDMVNVLLDAGASPDEYTKFDEQLIHRMAKRYQQRIPNLELELPEYAETILASKREWDLAIKKLEKAGYSLENALQDLKLEKEWRSAGKGSYLSKRRKDLTAVPQ
jgi:ankyrin repeat protein